MIDWFRQIEVLLIVAALTAMLARRLRLPYAVGLVAAGLTIHLAAPQLALDFSKEFVMAVLIPPLIFEAAYALRWERLRPMLPAVLTFATVGVMLSAGVMALVLGGSGLLDWRAATCLAIAMAAIAAWVRVESACAPAASSSSRARRGGPLAPR